MGVILLNNGIYLPDMRSQMLMGPAHREEGVDSRIRVFSTAKGRN